jgi:hypothetical protein
VYVPQSVARLSAAVPTLRNRLLLISKSPARSVQLLPRLVLLARLKSSLVGQPEVVLVGPIRALVRVLGLKTVASMRLDLAEPS